MDFFSVSLLKRSACSRKNASHLIRETHVENIRCTCCDVEWYWTCYLRKREKKSIKAIAFDKDGTLIEFEIVEYVIYSSLNKLEIHATNSISEVTRSLIMHTYVTLETQT